MTGKECGMNARVKKILESVAVISAMTIIALLWWHENFFSHAPFSTIPHKIAGVMICLLAPIFPFIPQITSTLKGEDWVSADKTLRYVAIPSVLVPMSLFSWVGYPLSFISFRILLNPKSYPYDFRLAMAYVMLIIFFSLGVMSKIGGHRICLINVIDRWDATDVDQKIILLSQKRDQLFHDENRTSLLLLFFLLTCVPAGVFLPLMMGMSEIALFVVVFLTAILIYREFSRRAFKKLCSRAETIGEMMRQGQTAELRQLKEKLERGLFRVKCSFAVIPVIIAAVVAVAVL